MKHTTNSAKFILFPGACDFEICGNRQRDCQDILYDNPEAPSGVYTVCIDGRFPSIQVYCDMDTYGGGWMVNSI